MSDIADDEPGPARLKDVVCPQCKRPFQIVWDDYGDHRQTLIIRSCPSGGIYDISIRCGHRDCDYEEPL